MIIQIDKTTKLVKKKFLINQPNLVKKNRLLVVCEKNLEKTKFVKKQTGKFFFFSQLKE